MTQSTSSMSTRSCSRQEEPSYLGVYQQSGLSFVSASDLMSQTSMLMPPPAAPSHSHSRLTEDRSASQQKINDSVYQSIETVINNSSNLNPSFTNDFYKASKD